MGPTAADHTRAGTTGDRDARRASGPRAITRTTAIAAVVAAVASVTAAVILGPVPRWPGAVHLVALPPLDVVADVRWLLARTGSWPGFVAAWAVLLAARTTLLAVVLARDGRPAWRPAVTVYAVATLPALLAAELDWIAHAVLYSRLHGAALVVAAITAVALAPLPFSGRDRLTAAIRASWRAGWHLPTLAAYLTALVTLGTLVEAAGPGWVAPAVPVSAALTAMAVRRLRRHRPVRPWLASGAVLAAVALLAAGVVSSRGAAWPEPAQPRDGSLVLMSGINSSSGEGAIFTLEPGVLGFTCEQVRYYSYAGPGDGQPRGVATCPIDHGAPYEPEDTQRPLAEQADTLAEQVADLPRPVTILAHSQAAWAAWFAASVGGLPEDTRIVLIGVFPSSPVGYPPPDTSGPGRVAGDLLRVLVPLSDLVDFDFEVEAPLSRELLATSDAAGDVLAAPLPSTVEALAVTATPDLSLLPEGWRIDGATDVCPIREAHPYLPITPTFAEEVDRFLAGDPPTGCPPWPALYRAATQQVSVPAASAPTGPLGG